MISQFSTSWLLLLAIVSPVYGQIVWDPIHNSCGLDHAIVVANGQEVLDEVVQLAKNAKDLMDKFDANALDPWRRFDLASTFDQIFDIDHPTMLDRWTTVKNNLQTIENIKASPPRIFIACDEVKFFGQETVGFITRQYFENPYTKVKRYITTLPQDPRHSGCYGGPVNADGTTTEWRAYTWFIAEDDLWIMMICKKNIFNVHRTLAMINVPNTFTALDSIDKVTTVSTMFFHELCHIMIKNMVGDMAGGMAAGGERYGWSGIQQISSSHADQNPDSLTHFALSLAFDNIYWLGPAGTNHDKAAAYKSLLQSAKRRSWIKLFGLS